MSIRGAAEYQGPILSLRTACGTHQGLLTSFVMRGHRSSVRAGVARWFFRLEPRAFFLCYFSQGWLLAWPVAPVIRKEKGAAVARCCRQLRLACKPRQETHKSYSRGVRAPAQRTITSNAPRRQAAHTPRLPLPARQLSPIRVSRTAQNIFMLLRLITPRGKARIPLRSAPRPPHP
jgi:hypothetical protein